MKVVVRAAGVFLGIVSGLWALLYVIFWYRRSGCWSVFDRSCNDALLVWLERLVSLGWVRDYQTLLGSVIAAVAAVWITNRYQESRISRQRFEEATAAALELQMYFTHVFNRLAVSGPFSDDDRNLGRLHALTSKLGAVNHDLSLLMHGLVRDIHLSVERRVILNELEGMSSSDRDSWIKSLGASTILRQYISSFMRNESPPLEPASIEPENVFNLIDALLEDPVRLGALYHYFKDAAPLGNRIV